MSSPTTSEPLLTYLMPAYAIASWISLLILKDHGRETLFCSASFGALWAVRNMYQSRKLDLGAVSMGIVAVASAFEESVSMCRIATLGCCLAAANFSLPLFLWKNFIRAARKKRSPFWIKTFRVYLISMTLFWSCAAYQTRKNEPVEE